MAPTPAKEGNLADLLSPAFARDAFRVDRSRPLTFICGGQNDGALRHQFLERANSSPRRIVPVLAERIFPHQLIEKNIHSFEKFLASAADCVLIFVESPGSFAETGMFAALTKIATKTLIINTREESVKKSFLSLGPIRLIRRKTSFDTVIDLAEKVVSIQDANAIVEAILTTYPKYKNGLVFHPEDKFTDLNLRLQLACVHMVVTLMRAGSAPLVTSVLREHFKAVEAEKIEMLLSLLTGINLLQRSDELYFNPSIDSFKDDALIFSVSFAVDNVRARAMEWQAENNSQVSAFLREQLSIDL